MEKITIIKIEDYKGANNPWNSEKELQVNPVDVIYMAKGKENDATHWIGEQRVVLKLEWERQYNAGRNANFAYAQFTGTDHYYKHKLTGFHYTDGIAQMAEDCGAYWFIDLVMSHQYDKKVREQEFQVWILKRIKDDKFIAICEDGNNNRVTAQEIPYSDFSYDTLKVYFENRVLCLPSER